MPEHETILVTGGAGYVGSALTPKLLRAGHRVKVLDLFLYGDHVFDGLSGTPNFEQIRGDIRDAGKVQRALQGCSTVIHLACISNDPSCELDPALTRAINLDAFGPLLEACNRAGVRRFIFASSSSVYGVSDAPVVAEDYPRVPITDYNRYKAQCEDILREVQSERFSTVVIRPATVCGYSRRLRLDLTVNILTSHAYFNRRITVFGGTQYRPNIHIDDMTDLYVQLVAEPDARVSGRVFNAGYQNRQVSEIAALVKKVVEREYPARGALEVVHTPSDDVRSYRISAEKIRKELGFVPCRTIEDAVCDLCCAFEAGRVPDAMTDSRYVNVRRMKELGLT